MTRFKLVIYSFVLAFFVGIGVLIAVSLIPYLHWIGVTSLVLLSFITLCGIRIMYAFTSSMVQQLYHRGNTLSNGQVVAYHNGSNIVHLSAMHEEAKVRVKELPAPTIEEVEEDVPYDEEAILTMYFIAGNTLKEIAKSLGLSYYQVQRIVAIEKNRRGLTTIGQN